IYVSCKRHKEKIISSTLRRKIRIWYHKPRAKEMHLLMTHLDGDPSRLSAAASRETDGPWAPFASGME
ncbi:hypothetical protein QIG60_26880, partial [Klebsiella pneumoniae]|nr:hypothetical protein [Klebsiella pneumoniae]